MKIGYKLAEKLEDMDDGVKKACITEIINMVGVGAVSLIVMIYIISEIIGTMPSPENAQLNETTNSIIGITGSSFNLAGVALIVIVAGGILFYVSNFGSMGGGGSR